MQIPTRKGAVVKSVNGSTENQHIWSTNSNWGANQIICEYLYNNDPFCRNGHPIASIQGDEDGTTIRYQ